MSAPKAFKIKPTREPIFSKKAHAYMRKLIANPKLGAEFLKKAGIMDENGQLAEPYRLQKWEIELMKKDSPKGREFS